MGRTVRVIRHDAVTGATRASFEESKIPVPVAFNRSV
jgi:hypothetical protein